MNTPTHEEIALQAQHLWRNRGYPEGCDTEIWLEAERQLSGGSPRAGGRTTDEFTERIRTETAAESVVEYHLSPAGTEQQAIKAAMQTPETSAPQVPHHPAPKAKPVDIDKSLRGKPLSS
jgi:hypothetical protein